MRILVINGDCVQVNSSANLCHLAYVRGFLEAGHDVTLLSAEGRDYTLDPAMQIPAGVKCFRYYGVSLYEKLSLKKKTVVRAANEQAGPALESKASLKRRLVRRLKNTALSFYGVYGIYAPFVKKAKRFRSEETFDYIVSLSDPATSHLLAHKLLRSGHVKSRHWIQIWEDPWYSDIYGLNRRDSVFREERRLLSCAERVCYVSPITLENQKKLFPEAAHKMYWQPLPAYYSVPCGDSGERDAQLFGYFGDYTPSARNLSPFYEAAKATGIRVNICGDPSSLFLPTDKIHIHPRMPLNELRPFEEKTDVLVFLCNRAGGQIPGKLYQYAATDKTILFILDGSEEDKTILRDYFEPFKRFVFCENTVESIEKMIQKILIGEYFNISNEPLVQFEPKRIIERLLMKGQS